MVQHRHLVLCSCWLCPSAIGTSLEKVSFISCFVFNKLHFYRDRNEKESEPNKDFRFVKLQLSGSKFESESTFLYLLNLQDIKKDMFNARYSFLLSRNVSFLAIDFNEAFKISLLSQVTASIFIIAIILRHTSDQQGVGVGGGGF